MSELPTPGRYAMYLRKSREDIKAEKAGKFETLAKHEAILTRYANDKGLNVVKIYRELVSGASLDSRADAWAMLEDVRAGLFDGVLAFDLQRVTRGDMLDQGTVVMAFLISHTLIVTPQKVYDLSDEIDIAFAELEMFFGRMELGRISRRLAVGKEEAVRQGQYIGSIAPYGYDKAVIDNKKTLVPNDDAQRVESWFRQIAEGNTSTQRIAKEMNSLGIPTPRSGLWDRSLILRVIRNPIYKGYVRWNNKKTVEAFVDGKKSKIREPGKEIIIKGLHEPLVSEELWQRANEVLSSRAKVSSPQKHAIKDPLASLLVCAHCGRSMYRSVSGHGRYETYQHCSVNKEQCWQRGAKISLVMIALAKELRNASSRSKERACRFSHKRKPAQYDPDIKSLDRSIENVFRLVERGMISDEKFFEKKQALEKQMAMLKAKREEAERNEASAQYYRALAANTMKAASSLSDYAGREEEVNRFLKSFIEKIGYKKDPETNSIHLRVSFK